MTVFLSGGCKNGKSSIAENTAVKLATKGSLYYIATMIPHDKEDFARIDRHVESREGKGFETIELGKDLMAFPEIWNSKGTYLLDSLTALLSNEMFQTTGYYPDAYHKVADDLIALSSSVKNLVIVSDYIYSSTEHYDSFTANYLYGLSYCDKILAKMCDVVCEVSMGNVIMYKGNLLLN